VDPLALCDIIFPSGLELSASISDGKCLYMWAIHGMPRAHVTELTKCCRTRGGNQSRRISAAFLRVRCLITDEEMTSFYDEVLVATWRDGQVGIGCWIEDRRNIELLGTCSPQKLCHVQASAREYS
jgi:hypothetical protein